MANGNFAGGTGVEGDPYLIEDALDLNAVRNDLTAHYKVINDIDLADMTWNPIGNSQVHATPSLYPLFEGVFDGDGYIISNLRHISNATQVGIFASVGGEGKVKNIIAEGFHIDRSSSRGIDSNRRGCIAGSLSGNAVIESCISRDYTIGGRWHIGGIAGWVEGNSVIKNCYSFKGVFVKYETNGSYGIADTRDNNSRIINCFTYDINADYGIDSRASAIQGSVYDRDASNVKNNTSEGISTSEAINIQTFIDLGWSLERADNNRSMWILKDGEYPRLWFEERTVFYYAAEGYWESPIIDLGVGWQETNIVSIVKQIQEGVTDCIIEIATSSDAISFTGYAELGESDLPQARFLKIRAILAAKQVAGGEKKTLFFNQLDEQAKIILNEFTEADGQLKLRVKHKYVMTEDALQDGGVIKRKLVKKKEWKVINSIEVSF